MSDSGTKLAAAIVIAGLSIGGGLIAKGCKKEPGPVTPSSVKDVGGNRLGLVTTAFKLVGKNHTIAVDEFKDPKVEGITIYISKAETGGISGSIGLAEDSSDASVAVRQTGPIKVLETFGKQENVFSESRSPLFKKLNVVRIWDENDKTFVYLAYSDKLVDGSPKNAISAVVAEDWNGVKPDLSVLQHKASPQAPAPR